MKFEYNKKYATFALYGAIVLFCVVLCVFFFLDFERFRRLLEQIFAVFRPIFYGILIAYLLSPILRFFENTLLSGLAKKGKHRLMRAFSVAFTVLGILLITGLVVWQFLPNILRGYADLQIMSGFYLNTVSEWLLSLSSSEGMLSGYLENIIGYALELLQTIYSAIFSIVPDVAKVAGAIVGIAKDLLFGIVLSIYFLSAKERLIAEGKKACFALFSEKRFRTITTFLSLADRKFGGFFKGQLADAIIVGTLCFCAMAIIGLPYYPLITILVAISTLIPVFGTVIGTVIGALIIFLADPYQAIWFLLLMLGIQVFNKKWLRPHLLRDGGDASSIFMFAALVIMTGLMGFPGLILGVPILTTLYAVFTILINRRLVKKGLPTDDLNYYTTEIGKELYLEDAARRGEIAETDTLLPEAAEEETPAS